MRRYSPWQINDSELENKTEVKIKADAIGLHPPFAVHS